VRRRWPVSFKGQLEVGGDPVDDLRFFDKRDDSHLATTGGAQQRVNFIDLANHLGPAFGGHIVWLIFNDRARTECRGSLTYLASVGIGVIKDFVTVESPELQPSGLRRRDSRAESFNSADFHYLLF